MHFRVVEFTLVQLLGHYLPESWFLDSEGFPDVGSVGSAVCDDISVQFSGDGSGEAPVHEDWPEDGHAEKVKPGGGHASAGAGCTIRENRYHGATFG